MWFHLTYKMDFQRNLNVLFEFKEQRVENYDVDIDNYHMIMIEISIQF